jgi:hypothetical protein
MENPNRKIFTCELCCCPMQLLMVLSMAAADSATPEEQTRR